MVSPFPGMDPFLEEPAEWSSVHTRLISAISDTLSSALAPNFHVNIEQRVYITSPDDPDRQSIAPEVYVVRSPQENVPPVPSMQVTTPTLVEPQYEPEIRDRFLEIRDTRSREVVTTIELLSPFNKAAGVQGRDAFMSKRKTVMGSNVNWIEIDLLRAGRRPNEVANKSDFYVLLKRGSILGPFEVWYFDLRDKMPTVSVPLRDPFPDYALDLQAVFDGIYSRAYYAESIDYANDVPPPQVSAATKVWINRQITDWSRNRS